MFEFLAVFDFSWIFYVFHMLVCFFNLERTTV